MFHMQCSCLHNAWHRLNDFVVTFRLSEMSEHLNLQSKMIEALLEEQGRKQASFTVSIFSIVSQRGHK